VFADDIELTDIKTECDNDFLLLQNDLDIFVDWCTIISFSLKKKTTYYDYVINNIMITQVN